MTTIYKIIIVSLIVAGLFNHCSLRTKAANLRQENLSLIQKNIDLQVRLAANPEAGKPQETKPQPAAETVLQSLSQGALSIEVKALPAEEKFCTILSYERNELSHECTPYRSHYSLLDPSRYGLPIFREDWSRGNGADSSLGMTLWTVEDGELIQALHLPTSRAFSTCQKKDEGGFCQTENQRWLKATAQLVEHEEHPQIRYRYLTETGAHGEVVYRWEKNAFVTAGNPPTELLRQYGF